MVSPDVARQSILNKARTDKFILSFTVPEALKQIASKSQRRHYQKSQLGVIPDQITQVSSWFNSRAPTDIFKLNRGLPSVALAVLLVTNQSVRDPGRMGYPEWNMRRPVNGA